MPAARSVLLVLVAAVLFSGVGKSAANDREFRLGKADAQSVALAGEFNHWQAQAMKKQPDGSWTLTVPLAPGTYGYKFLVNGSEWLFDPSLRAQNGRRDREFRRPSQRGGRAPGHCSEDRHPADTNPRQFFRLESSATRAAGEHAAAAACAHPR